MSITTADFKTGMTILYNNQIYTIVDFQHVKPGKGQAFVRTKLRNLRTSEYCFMDMETYEQVEIPAERLEWESKFLLEGMNIEIVFYGDEILGVNLPEKVSLEVTEASPAVAGNTATNALKEVKLETGLVVKVPMFIEQGDHVIVSTWDGKYNSRG